MNHIEINYSIGTPDHGASGPAGFFLRFHATMSAEYGWSSEVLLSQIPPMVLSMDKDTFLASDWAAPFIAQAHENLLPKLDAHVFRLTSTIAETRAHLGEAS